MVIPNPKAFGIIRPDTYSIERIHAKYLQAYFDKHHNVEITTAFPRTEVKIPTIVVHNPTSTVEYAGLGGYAGGVPIETITHTSPRKIDEDEIKHAPTITGKLGLRIKGNLVLSIFADKPDTRDKLTVWVISAYLEALENGWFTNVANLNETYDAATGRGALITTSGFEFSNFTKNEFPTDIDPKYLYSANITLRFSYHLNIELLRAVISVIEEEYEVVDE